MTLTLDSKLILIILEFQNDVSMPSNPLALPSKEGVWDSNSFSILTKERVLIPLSYKTTEFVNNKLPNVLNKTFGMSLFQCLRFRYMCSDKTLTVVFAYLKVTVWQKNIFHYSIKGKMYYKWFLKWYISSLVTRTPSVKTSLTMFIWPFWDRLSPLYCTI